MHPFLKMFKTVCKYYSNAVLKYTLKGTPPKSHHMNMQTVKTYNLVM